MVVLVDCDNFFASCERAMQPRLATVPVAVLSNNDGCVIARTEEVKAAGVTMGQPYHECKAILDKIGAVTVSANFLLYRHFAKRLQGILQALPSSSIEVYSIDESFVEMPDTAIEDPEEWAVTLRRTVFQWTGIPVSIGIAPSRALAKLATRLAKKNGKGVYVLQNGVDDTTSAILQSTPVEEVWGIGRKLSPKLRLSGILTAWDLANIDSSNPVLQLLDKTTQDLILELRGSKVLQDNDSHERKSIMHSRSFGSNLTDIGDVRAVLVDFSTQIARKLRKKDMVADRAVFSLRYRVEGKTYGSGKSTEIRFSWTNNSFDFATSAEQAAKVLFEPNRRYHKAMVLCANLRRNHQLDMYLSPAEREHKASLMVAIDSLEDRYGAAGPHIGSNLLNDTWNGKRQFVSPYNHAQWDKLPPVSTG